VALRPAILAGVTMSLAVMAVMTGLQHASNLVQLVSSVGAGGIVYTMTLLLLERPVVIQIAGILRKVPEK
jgi:formate/nitrite transporter FocA (FNT family)